MKQNKGPHKETEINPQLIAVMERDLGINQEDPDVPVSQNWTPPPRPTIPFHSIIKDPTQDPVAELYDMIQYSKALKTGS